MGRMPIEQWEDEFFDICERLLEEEPLYPYEHLWKKGLSPQEAFKAYLEENPDYAEKIHDSGVKPASEKEQQEMLALAKKLEQKKLEKEAEEKLSKFCPECARVMGKKKQCKCGYKRPSSRKKSDFDFY
jgi:predicted transcriptional regulator